MIKITLY